MEAEKAIKINEVPRRADDFGFMGKVLPSVYARQGNLYC
jgi:hypothetical protein